MNAECWGYLIGRMEDPAVVWNFGELSVKLYIPFLKYSSNFVLLFSSNGVLTGLHGKGGFTCNQLDDGCVQMGVCMLVDVKHYLGWYIFLMFHWWFHILIAPEFSL